jgi:hypothetical protein
MPKPNQKQLNWLQSLSTEEACKQVVKDAAAGTTVDPQKLLQKLSPLPNLKNRPGSVGGWVLAKIDLDISVEEAKILHLFGWSNLTPATMIKGHSTTPLVRP